MLESFKDLIFDMCVEGQSLSEFIKHDQSLCFNKLETLYKILEVSLGGNVDCHMEVSCRNH